MGRLKRPRKPATILRELREAIASLHALGGWANTDVHAARCYDLARELSRAIATSGKAPGR